MAFGSPFGTPRAAARAPQVLEYAAAMGSAILVSPSGAIAMTAGAADVDFGPIARIATTLASRTRESEEPISFPHGTSCVHVARVSAGWTLCAVVTFDVAPAAIAERLRRAAYVLGLALRDAPPFTPGSGNGGAAAEVFVALPKPRPS
jgi:hypothetical protein